MELKLIAGAPNDANRDYVPMAIKGTDMVVNENGNNSQVYPAGLKEITGIVADGLEDRWYEYVPASYDGSKAVPLVVSLHGGLMNGWAQSVYSSWTLLAEREGFICVFPDCHALQMWTLQGMAARVRANPELVLPIPMDPEDYHDNHDLNYVKGLIGVMQEKYNIDKGRIYMQGMSMGHMMTDQFARFYGDILAGAAGSGAACIETELYAEDGTIRNYGGPTPMWISHPECNGMDAPVEMENSAQKNSRKYWMQVNECDPLPRIKIVGEDNFAFFTGKKADLTFLDIKNRDHGQALDEAFYYWNYMFSGLRREEDGSVSVSETIWDRNGDRFAIAFAPNSGNAWFENSVKTMTTPAQQWQKLKYHGLDGGQMVRGEYLCVSAKFLAEVFGAEYAANEDGSEVMLTLRDGRKVQFARGIIGCLVNNDMHCMYCEALHRNGELLVSAEWFCRFLFNLHVTKSQGVVYITDHFAELSTYMAELIKDILD
jgi:poly(3-hydroxybutyrate) depolymerase